jgi:hypothetical protein
MKNLALLLFFVIGITSCSKDSIDPTSGEYYTITKSEILVTVTHMVYYNNGQCGNGCGSGDQGVIYVSNASINIFPGDIKEGDQSVAPIAQGRSSSDGKVLVKDLEPGQYTVVVQSSYGTKSRVLYTQLSQRSSIEFSF